MAKATVAQARTLRGRERVHKYCKFGQAYGDPRPQASVIKRYGRHEMNDNSTGRNHAPQSQRPRLGTARISTRARICYTVPAHTSARVAEWQTRRSQKPLGDRVGSSPTSGTSKQQGFPLLWREALFLAQRTRPRRAGDVSRPRTGCGKARPPSWLRGRGRRKAAWRAK